MRKLFLLQGAPGCGKSTFIDHFAVHDLTLSYDHFRSLYGVTGFAFDGVVNSLTRAYETAAIEACQQAAESRMLAGATVFIDNTNTKTREILQWKERADKYGYETFVVNLQGDLTDEELLARNANRSTFDKISDEKIILRKAAACRQHQKIAGIRYIKAGEVDDELRTEIKDLSDREGIVIVGDVQGCGNALSRLISKVGAEAGVHPNRLLYVFVGDYFDRGKTPEQVLSLLSGAANVVRVEGNHERSVRHTLTGVRSYSQSEETVKRLRENGYGNPEILSFVNDTVPFFPFVFHGQEYWVTHAGITPRAVHQEGGGRGIGYYYTGFIPNYNFFMGTGRRGDIYTGRSSYTDFLRSLDFAHDGTEIIQYFGHRNDDPDVGPLEYRSIRPLESKVEFGGFLTAVLLTKDGESVIRVEGEK